MVQSSNLHPHFLISETINMEIKLLHFLFMSPQNVAPLWLLTLSLIIPPAAFNCIWHIEYLACCWFGPSGNFKCWQADTMHKQIPGIQCYSQPSPEYPINKATGDDFF